MDQHQREKLSNTLILLREEIAMKMQLIADLESGQLQPESIGTSIPELSEALAKSYQEEENLVTILEDESEKLALQLQKEQAPFFDPQKPSRSGTRPSAPISLDERLNRFCHDSLARFLLEEECSQLVEHFQQIMSDLGIDLKFELHLRLKNDPELYKLTLVFPDGHSESVVGSEYTSSSRAQASAVIEFLPVFTEHLPENSLAAIILKRWQRKDIEFIDSNAFGQIRRNHHTILQKVDQKFELERTSSNGLITVEIPLNNGVKIIRYPYPNSE